MYNFDYPLWEREFGATCIFSWEWRAQLSPLPAVWPPLWPSTACPLWHHNSDFSIYWEFKFFPPLPFLVCANMRIEFSDSEHHCTFFQYFPVTSDVQISRLYPNNILRAIHQKSKGQLNRKLTRRQCIILIKLPPKSQICLDSQKGIYQWLVREMNIVPLISASSIYFFVFCAL